MGHNTLVTLYAIAGSLETVGILTAGITLGRPATRWADIGPSGGPQTSYDRRRLWASATLLISGIIVGTIANIANS